MLPRAREISVETTRLREESKIPLALWPMAYGPWPFSSPSSSSSFLRLFHHPLRPRAPLPILPLIRLWPMAYGLWTMAPMAYGLGARP